MFATIDTLTVRLWDTKTGKSLGQLQRPKPFWGMSFSTDERRILTWGDDRTITISDLSTNTAQIDLKCGGDILLAHFSPDGEYIIIGYSNESIEILNSKSGKLITRIDSTQIVYKHYREWESIVVDQESKYVIGDVKNSVKIWRLGSGELLHELAGHSTAITSIALSPDGKTIVTASSDQSAKVWDIQSGNIVNTLNGHSKGILDVIFNKNGDRIITASQDHTAKSWDSATGRLLHTMGGNFQGITEAAFTPDNNSIIIGYRNQDAKVWDCSVGKPGQNMSGHLRNIYGVEFNGDGFTFVTTSQNETARVWNLRTGKLSFILKGHQEKVNRAQFTPDGNSIVTTSNDGNVKIWDQATGVLRYTFEGSFRSVPMFALSPEGKYIATESDDKVAIWDLGSGTLIRNIYSDNGHVSFIAFHPKGGMIMTGCIGGTVRLSDVSSGKLIQELHAGFDRSSTGIFSRDGAQIITSYKDSIQFWDTESAKILRIIPGQRLLSSSWEPWDYSSWNPSSYSYFSPFRTHDPGSSGLSPDGKTLITSSINRTINIWDLTKNILVKTVSQKGFLQEINWATRKLLFIENSVLTMVDIDSGNELLSFACIGEADWVVTHPSGLFDASPGAMDQLYFAQGLDLINFKQLKERYFEPDLWKRVVKNETLRSVEDLKSVELPPDIIASVDEQGYLNVQLKNKGGGIGEVNVFVNGKEVLRDARQDLVNIDQDSLQIKLFIAKNRNIVKGQENIIGIKAWNKGHWVVSKGKLISYNSNEIESYEPAIHILSCGISDYTGEEIDLKYAAKDAEDMTRALQLGARQLFGVKKSYVYSLTTNRTKQEYPTKKNILKALEKIAASAHPLDVFILYLSGHGINYGGQDGDWYYLTQDAYTAVSTAYSDPSIKNLTTLSSTELVEQVKKIAALKQVLIIDACASGKVLDNLMARKDLPSSTLRSLDRMKDRTGMHIITGSTADEVSYEASKYSQGVLTYSLLEAMRGAALRENQYIDVNILFQYAQDRVPVIAEGIGGIQSPGYSARRVLKVLT